MSILCLLPFESRAGEDNNGEHRLYHSYTNRAVNAITIRAAPTIDSANYAAPVAPASYSLYDAPTHR